jgi:hypothetical protein
MRRFGTDQLRSFIPIIDSLLSSPRIPPRDRSNPLLGITVILEFRANAWRTGRLFIQ